MGTICSTHADSESNQPMLIYRSDDSAKVHSKNDPSASASGGGTATPTTTLQNYGYLCRSTANQILNHDQLAMFASLAETVRFNPKQVIYAAGDPVGATGGLYFVVEGSATVSKLVELKELTNSTNKRGELPAC